jgi:hypothetical protein
MDQPARDPQLEALNALVGTWALEATHPAVPSAVVRGEAAVEWLEGERFLIHRASNDHPDFPDSISVIGLVDDALSMYYFDSRGVHRIYEVAMEGSSWRMWRDAPGFSQRFTGTFEDGGDTIAGQWELSRDDETWDDDLRITYRRSS